MNLPYILRKYFGGNLHLKRKWKARIEKGLKWLKIWKGYWCQILLKKQKKKKKNHSTFKYSSNIVIIWAYCRERAMMWTLWISLLLFFLPSIFPVCFDFPYPILSQPSPCGLLLQPWLKTFWSLILVFDYISGEDFWKLDLWG